MKSLSKIIVVFSCILLLFASCKKDKNVHYCDGKGTLHYFNNSGDTIKILVDNVDYGYIVDNRAIEIPLREGSFHYIIYKNQTGTYYWAKEGDVVITECEAQYVNYK